MSPQNSTGTNEIGCVERSGMTGDLFPLTPALSLGERENNRQRLGEAGALGNIERLPLVPPLPKGEGRGEGKEDVRTTAGADMSNACCRHTRRDFFKTFGLAGASLVATITPAAASSAHLPDNAQSGMLYDATKCVGCKACMTACKRVNARPGGLAFEQAKFDQDGLWDAPEDLSGNTRTLIKLFKDTKGWSYVKYSCMHCQKPSCVSVCPVSAMTKDPVTGIVDYSKDVCIGCRYCQVACPFNIPKFQWDRTLPRIVKCDLCRNTNLKDKGIPACAETCPAGAILFGKRKDLLAEARTRLRQHPERYVPHIYGEHEIGGTNHLYLAALPFGSLGLPVLPSDAPAAFSEQIQHTIYKGFIAPIALYVSLCCIAVRNLKKGEAQPAPAVTPKKEV